MSAKGFYSYQITSCNTIVVRSSIGKGVVVLAFIDIVLFALAPFFLMVAVDELVAAVVTRHHNNEMVPHENGI